MKSKLAAHAAVFLLAFANIAIGNPNFQYEFKEHAKPKETNSIMAFEEKTRTVFQVTDSFGIGGATIILVSGGWPKHVTLRFRYEKSRGFHRLEEFDVKTARLQARGGMQDSGKVPFYFLDIHGKSDSEDSPAGELNITVKEHSNAMEVTLPPNLLVGTKEVKIGWIGAYR